MVTRKASQNTTHSSVEANRITAADEFLVWLAPFLFFWHAEQLGDQAGEWSELFIVCRIHQQFDSYGKNDSWWCVCVWWGGIKDLHLVAQACTYYIQFKYADQMNRFILLKGSRTEKWKLPRPFDRCICTADFVSKRGPIQRWIFWKTESLLFTENIF